MNILKNKKHEHFALLVAKGQKPEQSYITAGYSRNGARNAAARLLRNRGILLRIDELRAIANERIVEKTGVDKAWVIQELVENVRMAKAAIPVKNKEGENLGEYKQDLSAANKALELIGKELGMFIDRKIIQTGALDNLGHHELKQLEHALNELLCIGENTADNSGGFTH